MGTSKKSTTEDKNLTNFEQGKSEGSLNKKNLDSLKGGAGHEYTYSKTSSSGGTTPEGQ